MRERQGLIHQVSNSECRSPHVDHVKKRNTSRLDIRVNSGRQRCAITSVEVSDFDRPSSDEFWGRGCSHHPEGKFKLYDEYIKPNGYEEF
jgi:hypothetical protein